MSSVVEAYWDAASRLCDHYGHDTAEEMLDQAKLLARVDSVLKPEDLYKLGIMLSELDGFAGQVGTTMKITALLAGAQK
jgi:hypothetical protein